MFKCLCVFARVIKVYSIEDLIEKKRYKCTFCNFRESGHTVEVFVQYNTIFQHYDDIRNYNDCIVNAEFDPQ